MAEDDVQLPLSPKFVGDSFVQQYYATLNQSPEYLYHFYHDMSTLTRPETNGPTSLTTTMQAIKEKMVSFNSGNFTLEIKSVDAQASFHEGVHMVVTGNMKCRNDNTDRHFTQSFFLAPQEKGYFVLNDIFRFVGDTNDDIISSPVEDVLCPPTPEHDHSPGQETFDSKETTEIKEVLWEEKNKPFDVEQALESQEEVLSVPEIVNEIPNDTNLVAISSSEIVDVPKKTYASIVTMMKGNVKPFSSPAPVLRKPVMKTQEQVSLVPVSISPTETQVTGSDSTENAKIPESEADGFSIFVKGLPVNVMIAQLEEEFKRFGTVKSGGIQIKNNRGFCFGFVEFEVSSAVQQAIEASPITIGGRQVRIEEKKSTISPGINKDRNSFGRGGHGGFRNEGTRGRQYYGSSRGRYHRNSSNGRSEFGNKIGNREGGEVYKGSGDFSNEDGSVFVEGTATSSTPCVTVTA